MSIVKRTLVFKPGTALEGQTCVKAGVQFVGGRATIEGSDKDVIALSRFLEKCYQAVNLEQLTEEGADGECEIDSDDGTSSVPAGDGQLSPVEGDVSTDGRAPEVSADECQGDDEDPAGDSRVGPEGDGQEGSPVVSMCLAEALSALDSENDEHWEADTGRPRLAAVVEIAGTAAITRADIDEVAPELRRGGK